MIEFTIAKTALKNALAVSKRALPKKDGKTILVGRNNEMFVFTRGEGLEVFDYIPLQNTTESFAIEIDPAPVEKWLDGKDRELLFQITETTKGKNTIHNLFNVEKKKSEPVKLSPNPEKSFLEVRNYPFVDFNAQEEIIKSWYEANNMFQKSDRIYSEYALLSDINLMVFDPLFFSAFFYNEEFGIANKYGTDGIAVPQVALDTLVKTIKKPKEFKHFLTDKRFLLKEADTIFSMNYSTDIKFPDPRTLEALDKSFFKVDAEAVSEGLKNFPNNKVTKVKFSFDNTHLTISTDNPEFEDVIVPCEAAIPNCAFVPSAVKALFEGLSGEVEINFTTYNSKTTKNGYYWKYQDREKVKIVPGIKEALGFSRN